MSVKPAGPDDLTARYRGYLDCLNAQDWGRLGEFVADDVVRNDARLGLDGYRAMLEADFRAIPDLRFEIGQLAVESPTVAARLQFDCHPAGVLFGLPVNGRRVRFAEHVFYAWRGDRIAMVWSLIDVEAIAGQI